MSERALSSCKKKRGVIKASLTRLGSRLRDAESSTDPEEARRLTEFSDIRHSLFSLDVEDIGDLGDRFTQVEGSLFTCSLNIKRLLRTHAPPEGLSRSGEDYDEAITCFSLVSIDLA